MCVLMLMWDMLDKLNVFLMLKIVKNNLKFSKNIGDKYKNTLFHNVYENNYLKASRPYTF